MSSRALRNLMSERSEECNEEEFEVTTKASIFSQVLIPSDTQLDCDNSDEIEPACISSQNKKKKKKRKIKQKRNVDTTEPELDELKILDELKTVDTDKHFLELLRVNTKLLDPEAELSRLFGFNVVEPHAARGRSKRFHSKLGSLVLAKSSWPPTVKMGLTMDKSSDGLYSFVHNKDYQIIQKKFYYALDSMDPNNLSKILFENPYHIDSLLQLSDIMMHQDNSPMAIDLLERALYAFQSTFHPSFNPFNGTGRLDYRKQVNRGLFIALFRYIIFIGDRGSNRSALEYCKLLFSLDYEKDPLTVLLMIDKYAIFSKQYAFLIELYDILNGSHNLYLLPNFAFSIPLARKLQFLCCFNDADSKMISQTDDIDLALQDALVLFPGFLTRILKHTSLGGVNNLDKSKLFGTDVQSTESKSLSCLLSLYVARMHAIWTSPSVLPWLEKNVEYLLKLAESTSQTNVDSTELDARIAECSVRRKTLYPNFPPKILRHLSLTDLPEAQPVIPQNLQNVSIYGFDPFPPKDSINIYDLEEERRLIRAQNVSGGFFTSLFSSILPSFSAQHDSNRPNQADVGLPSSSQELTALGSFGSLVQSVTDNFSATLRQVLERIDFDSTLQDGDDEEVEEH